MSPWPERQWAEPQVGRASQLLRALECPLDSAPGPALLEAEFLGCHRTPPALDRAPGGSQLFCWNLRDSLRSFPICSPRMGIGFGSFPGSSEPGTCWHRGTEGPTAFLHSWRGGTPPCEQDWELVSTEISAEAGMEAKVTASRQRFPRGESCHIFSLVSEIGRGHFLGVCGALPTACPRRCPWAPLVLCSRATCRHLLRPWQLLVLHSGQGRNVLWRQLA